MVERTISYYRVKTRTKKWTVKVLIHMIDLAPTNLWLQYRRDCQMQGLQTKDILKFIDCRISVSEKLIADGSKTTIFESSEDDEYQPAPK